MAKEARRYRHYDLEFKIKLVMLYIEGEGGCKGLARAYGLKDSRQLRNRLKKYQDGKLTETEADKRGESSNGKHGRAKARFEAKEEEWGYLRFENECLKKKLLTQGKTEDFIANLRPSKNLK